MEGSAGLARDRMKIETEIKFASGLLVRECVAVEMISEGQGWNVAVSSKIVGRSWTIASKFNFIRFH